MIPEPGKSPRLRGHARKTLLPLAAGACILAACDQTGWPERDPAVLVNPAVDSVTFWPAGMRFAAPGDSLVTEVRGLRRGYACARVPQLAWVAIDSGDGIILRLSARVELPRDGRCALDRGLDTSLRIAAPAPGVLRLQTTGGRTADSLAVVPGQTFTDAFVRIAPAGTETFHGRYRFRDSTAGHPRRTVSADSLDPCEILLAAVFRHVGDTVTVRVRRLRAEPAAPELFPPCSGPRADTIPIVPDRLRLPG